MGSDRIISREPSTARIDTRINFFSGDIFCLQLTVDRLFNIIVWLVTNSSELFNGIHAYGPPKYDHPTLLL